MDSLGDRAAAGKFWQEAIKGGEDQGKLLLPELRIPLPAGPAGGEALIAGAYGLSTVCRHLGSEARNIRP